MVRLTETGIHSGWTDQQIVWRQISGLWTVLFSFEFLLAGLISIGAYKAHPTFAWLFPLDGTLMVLAATAGVAAYIIARNGLPPFCGFPMGLYLLFCAWTLTTIFWTKERTLEPLIEYVLRTFIINGVIFFGAIAIVATSRVRVVRFLLATALLAFPLSIDYIINAGIAFRGTLDDRNYLLIGRVVSAGFAVCFGFMIYLRPLSWRWVLCVAGTALTAYALLIIGSRQSFIAIVGQALVAMAMATYLSRGSIRVQPGLVPALVTVVIGLAVLTVLMPSGMAGWTLRRMASLVRFAGGDLQADDSAGLRLQYMMAAFQFWSDSWWSVFFGDGLFSFAQQFRGEYRPGAQPHNLVAAILAEFGIVGLVLFVFLLASILVSGTFLVDSRSSVAAVLVALICGAAFRTVAAGDMATTIVLLAYMALLSSFRESSRTVAVPRGKDRARPRAQPPSVRSTASTPPLRIAD